MSILDFEEFFFVFFREVVFIALGSLIVASIVLAMFTMVRLVNEA